MNGPVRKELIVTLEIDRQKIIGEHHFAHASTECIHLYRDGHFISTVMTTQAVNEGIIKFVAGRNNIQHENMNHSERLKILKDKSIISQDCLEASEQIRRSYRNDVHHMNPPIGQINFPELAKKNGISRFGLGIFHFFRFHRSYFR